VGTPSVTIRQQGSVAVITIDDGKVNAFDQAMTHDLLGVLGEAERQARAVVLSGRPGVFSAGLDLGVIRSGGEAASRLLHGSIELFLRLAEFSRPVVAACTGHALATGATMLLCSDVRIGAEGDFQIGQNEVAAGFALSELTVELARFRLSPRHLTMACNLGQTYSPAESVDVGFLDLVTAGDVTEQAVATAAEMAERVKSDPFIATRRITCRRLTDTIFRTSGQLLRVQRADDIAGELERGVSAS